MKITRVETIPVRVPIKPELAIRSGRGGAHTVSPFLLVKVHTDEGVVGLGEASCTPRWSGEDQVTAAHFINAYFAPLLTGETVATGGSPVADSVENIERLTTKFASTVARNYFTKAAVEMALWDIAGKAHGKPVCEIARGVEHGAKSTTSDSPPPAPSSVPTKWSVSGVEPAKAAEIAQWAVAQGFSAMKVKVGIDPNGDLDRVRAVRAAVEPQVKLGVDANGGWPTPQIAIDTIRRLCDECGIYFAEQPVPAGLVAADGSSADSPTGEPPVATILGIDAMAEVRRNVPVPIIADESIYTLADARMLARAAAADVFSIYIGKAGGIGPALEIARFARAAGIACTIGSNLELGVGTAAMIHLALSAPAIDADTYPCDIIGPLFYEDDILTEPLRLAGGEAQLPAGPGLGVELDDAKVEKYRVA